MTSPARTDTADSSSDSDMADHALDHLDDSRRFDMREQVVRQMLANALHGIRPDNIQRWLDTTAADILVWLDDYDADATRRAHESGFRSGIAFAQVKAERQQE